MVNIKVKVTRPVITFYRLNPILKKVNPYSAINKVI